MRDGKLRLALERGMECYPLPSFQRNKKGREGELGGGLWGLWVYMMDDRSGPRSWWLWGGAMQGWGRGVCGWGRKVLGAVYVYKRVGR